SVFDGGAYRVQPGQRVMFERGSLTEVVDHEKETCGCPPPTPKGNEFQLAKSEGLAPTPAPSGITLNQNSAPPQVAPLVYKAQDQAPQPAPETKPAPVATPAQTNPPAKKG